MAAQNGVSRSPMLARHNPTTSSKQPIVLTQYDLYQIRMNMNVKVTKLWTFDFFFFNLGIRY